MLVAVLVIARIQGTVPSFFGYSVLNVVSGSMEPEIPTGSFIIIGKTQPQDLAVGDVITFYSQQEPIKGSPNTHRIVSVRQRDGKYYFVTKGDANNVNDGEISQDYVIGKYLGRSAFFTAVGSVIKDPVWFFVIILVPAAGLFVYQLIHFSRLRKEGADEEDGTEEKNRDRDAAGARHWNKKRDGFSRRDGQYVPRHWRK